MNTTNSTAYYRVQRTCQARLFAPKLAAFTFWGWQLVIVRAAITLPLGYTRSKEYAELEGPIDILILHPRQIIPAKNGRRRRLDQASATGTTTPVFCATKCRTLRHCGFPLLTFGTKLPRRVDYQLWTTGQATGMCSAICPTICVKGSYTLALAARLSISPVVPPFARYISTA